jgi:predicted GNAT family acetyltransferase
MPYEVRCFATSDVAAFMAMASSFLQARVDQCNQVLGFVRDAQAPSMTAAVFAVATCEGQAVAVLAWCPVRIAISEGPEPAIRLLVTTLIQRGLQISVLKGPVEAVNSFADEIRQQAHGKKAEVTEEALLYRCDALNAGVKMPKGAGRRPTVEDLDRFCNLLEEDKGGAVDRAQFRALLADPEFCNTFFVWCSVDGTIVAKAKYTDRTPHGGETAPIAVLQGVFTPADSRGKGYATGVMYGLCEALLEQYKLLVLYVEKTNGPANRLYQKIGFKEVEESKMVKFVDP